MNAAYVGILTPGSTSRMRAECLRGLRPDWRWEWLDTDPPLMESARAWQSLAYRFKTGLGVARLNAEISDWIMGRSFDLVWIDKAIFLYPTTVQLVRSAARRLVHFTPDTAFHANRSRHFEQTLRSFDMLVTTKSFELADYKERLTSDKVLLTTQGYDPRVHYPRNGNDVRQKEVAFVGLAEPDRERCVTTLLEHGITVRLAGHGWDRFARRWNGDNHLKFEGAGVFGDAYAKILSEAWVGLGLLTKRFPELHTTRTFEIPACGAILATERTSETESFYSDREAIFFNDFEDLATRIAAVFNSSPELLETMGAAGIHRVNADKRGYNSILSAILSDPRLSL